MNPLRRHTLVWLSHPPLPVIETDAAAVTDWQSRGLPFVVCRQRDGHDVVSLGFCPPPDARREERARRIAVQASRDQIKRADRPPGLKEVFPGFEALSDSADQAGLDVRAFGSWMWQTITGTCYTNAASDLDLVIDVASATQVGNAIAFLEVESEHVPFRLDAELSFPAHGEVHWREYAGESPEVLVKSISGVRMMRKDDLWKP